MASEIRLKLLQLVLDNPEIKRDAIRAHKVFEDEDDRALANLLYNCKKDEQLVADGGGRYTITARGRKYLKGAGVELLEAAKPYRSARRALFKSAGLEPPPVMKGSMATRGIADKLLHQAQAALDEYIASVCDPEILGRFRAARDGARGLVGSLNGVGNDEGGKEHG
jgi:hypothetical protein